MCDVKSLFFDNVYLELAKAAQNHLKLESNEWELHLQPLTDVEEIMDTTDAGAALPRNQPLNEFPIKPVSGSVPNSILGWICTSIGLLQTSLGGSHAPVMLVGNKSDRVTEREVSTQVGSALAKEMGCDFVEASAKQCINVEKAF